MRIPEDITFRPISTSRQQRPDERNAEPVDSLTASKDALSDSRSKQNRNADERNNAEDNPLKRQAQEAPDAYPKERRQQDRRQRQVKVLLDTRINPSRRKSAQHPSIDIKI